SMVAAVATVSPKKRPFMTPLWFVVDGDALYITTGPETWAARNVAAHPAVTLLFRGEHHGGGAGRALPIRGAATPHHGPPGWRVLLRIAAKYYVAPRALAIELPNATRWSLRARYYAQGGAGYLRVVPEAAEFVNAP